ncbi:hypothetical protein MRX96_038478 [Rhipicephalus microplus]
MVSQRGFEAFAKMLCLALVWEKGEPGSFTTSSDLQLLRLCSVHFTSRDYVDPGQRRLVLCQQFPSLFLAMCCDTSEV